MGLNPSHADEGEDFRWVGTKARLYTLPVVTDYRGCLTFAEIDNPLPFVPKRYFFVYAVPSREIRGEHAHRECQQFLVCVKGSCSVIVDDGSQREEVLLDRPNLGLYLAPMVWATEHQYSQDAILMVLASDIYRPEDYIRDYAQFLHERQYAR